jgi:hopanoid biosynthesis associated RND transporter like protein HpnN
MGKSLVARIVGFSSRLAGLVVLATLAVSFAAGYYVSGHFAMNSRTEDLISPQTDWRLREAVYDKAFPQQNQLIVVVVDGVTPEQADWAAQSLAAALAPQKKLFRFVRRPDDGAFFTHDGLLLLPAATVKSTMDQLIQAQPFLAALAADPSLRGISDNISTALLGVEHGQAKLADLDRPMAALSGTLDDVLAGKPAFLSWRAMITGARPSLRETRRFIEMRPVLDFQALMPGAHATQIVRDTAARLGLDARNGVRVRITGPIPMADDEYGSLTERARLMATLMMIAVLTMLWIALKSPRLIFAVLLTVFAGLTITTAAGLLAVGAFNLISVAFIALFVGLGVDFGIQFCVRYRAERHECQDIDLALVRTGAGAGEGLALAAAATAAGFYSFLPTSYRGVAELGVVAGTGMLITFALSVTFLPALMRLLSPPGEPDAVGIRALAPYDRIIQNKKRHIVVAAGVVAIAGIASLPVLEFDFNPLDMRNTHLESVSTALDLMKDPDTSPSTLNILLPSIAAADSLAKRLSRLPEVGRTMTVDSFVPDDQAKKLAIVSDADALLDPTINPFATKPPPSDADVAASFKTAAADLVTAAGRSQTPAARHARALADAFRRLAASNAEARGRANNALVPGLRTMLDEIRAILRPYAVTEKTLPADLVSDWVSPNGLYRLEVYPSNTANTNGSLRAFTTAVRKIAPQATGTPIIIQESGRTIVRAFLQAGVLSFIVIAALLLMTLRNVTLVALTLGPLMLAGLATLATCVAVGLPLNYANIIALPLLLGIGVAFDIYFVVAWQSGTRDLLGSPLTRAVILSAGTTASAFGTLWISSHPGTASMGELLAIALAWILVMVLVLLPALLALAVPDMGLKPEPARGGSGAGLELARQLASKKP